MLKKLGEWTGSSACSLLMAALTGFSAILWFGHFVGTKLEESR